MPVLVHLVIVLIILGLLIWVVEQFIPLDPVIKRIIHVVLLIIVILYILRIFGFAL